MMSVVRATFDQGDSKPVPDQESGSRPKPRPFYKRRLATAVLHAFSGTMLVICGIVVLILRFPGPDYTAVPVRYGKDDGDGLDEKDSFSIWMGLFLILTSAFGFRSRRNRAVLWVYTALNVFAAAVAAAGLLLAVLSASGSKFFRDRLHRLSDEIRWNPSTRACFVPDYDPYKDGALDNVTQQAYDECIELHIGATMTHEPFYYIMVAFFGLEFANGLSGFAFAVVGLYPSCRNS